MIINVDLSPSNLSIHVCIIFIGSRKELYIYNYFIFDCINNSAIVWLSISYVYKALLQILAMFMAFHTRKVKIKALNDSKEIAIIIYINSITLSILAFVEIVLNEYHYVYAALFGLSLLVGATLFLTLLFVPKVLKK